jgi:16S rRNA (cytosine967-C5)-methyltransferase
MPRWTQLFGEAAPRPLEAEGGSLVLTPRRTGTDGFFVVALKRSG